MRKVMVSLLAVMLLFATVGNTYASDWDKAGKALAIIEGVRILTSGNVDLIGKVTGVQNTPRASYTSARVQLAHARPRRQYAKAHRREMVWVPTLVWKKKWIPEHTEYDPEYSEIIVEGHYVRYQAEDGGQWVPSS